MNVKHDNDDLFGELFGDFKARKRTVVISPTRQQQRATIAEESTSDADDDFALPATPPTRPAGQATTSSGKSLSTAAPPAVIALPAKEVEKEETEATVKGKSSPPQEKPDFDQTKFEDFQQVANQKRLHWDSITPEQLVWYQSYPAIVVPEHLHFAVPVIKRPDDVTMAYGPGATSALPGAKPYVILQYLPLCLKCYDMPETLYVILRGQLAERVRPYNTIMAKGKKGDGQDWKPVGDEDKWAATDHHFRQVKKHGPGKSLARKNWDASMAYAQKFLDRALELKARRAKLALEESRLAEEEERQRREKLELEAAEARAVGEEKAGGGHAESAEEEPEVRSVKIVKGLRLAPGDRIVYWDRTKIAGAAGARIVATVMEIRTKKEAREGNVGRLVLDNNQIVLDDWVIQRLITDAETGKESVDRQGCKVEDHNLNTGKLAGSGSSKDKRMTALISKFKKDIVAYGAGDQLREASKRGGGGAGGVADDDDDDDDDDKVPSGIKEKSKTLPKDKGKASAADGKKIHKEKGTGSAARKGSLVRKDGGSHDGGGGANSAGGSRGGRDGATGSRGVGGSSTGSRKGPPLGDEDVGDAIAASIAKARRKEKKPKPMSDSKRAKTTKAAAVEQRPQAEEWGEEEWQEEKTTPREGNTKLERGEEKLQNRPVVLSNKRSGGTTGSERGSEDYPVAKRRKVLASSDGDGCGAL